MYFRSKPMIIVTQTYLEYDLVAKFLEAWSAKDYNINIVVANSGYPDATSTLIEKYENVFEVKCCSADFWTEATRKALLFVETNFQNYGSLVITNIDVRPLNIGNLIDTLNETPFNSLLSLPVRTGTTFYYSGLKRRKYGSIFPKKILPSAKQYVEIDYAPTRFVFVKVNCNQKLSQYLPCDLPHYGADFVFTHNLKILIKTKVYKIIIFVLFFCVYRIC